MTYKQAQESLARCNGNSRVFGAASPNVKRTGRRQLSDTILRITIPENSEMSLLNLLEISSPSGINLIVKLPLLSERLGNNLDRMAGIVDSIRKIGGTVEVLE